MKLHLPKQLFTALLAALTLAAPAAVTLGSAVWGRDVDGTETWTAENPVSEGADVVVDSGDKLTIESGEHTVHSDSQTIKMLLKNGGSVTMNGGVLTLDYLHIHNAKNSNTEVFTQTGGIVNVTAADDFSSQGTGTKAPVTIGHWGDGTGELNITGGTFNTLNGSIYMGHDSKAILNISNTGVVNTVGLYYNKDAGEATASEVTLSGGGRLNLGAGGIQNSRANTTASRKVTLTSGTLGTLTQNGWTLSGVSTTIGSITIDTDVWDATTGATATGDAAGSANISLLGELTAAEGGMVITLAGAGSLTIDHTLNGTINLAEGSTAKVLIDTADMSGFTRIFTGTMGSTGASGFVSGYHIYHTDSTAQVYSIGNQDAALSINNGIYEVATTDFVVCDVVNREEVTGTVSKFYVETGGQLNITGTTIDPPIANAGQVNINAGEASVSLSSLFGSNAITQEADGIVAINTTGAVSTGTDPAANAADQPIQTIGGTLQINNAASFTNNKYRLEVDKLVLQDVANATISGIHNGGTGIVSGEIHVLGSSKLIITGKHDLLGWSGNNYVDKILVRGTDAENPATLQLNNRHTWSTILELQGNSRVTNGGGTSVNTSNVGANDNVGMIHMHANGAINVSGENNVCSVVLFMNSAGTITVDSDGSLLMDGMVYGSSALTKEGDGTLTFSGKMESLSGALNVNAGKVIIADTAKLGSNNLVSNATLEFATTDNLEVTNTISGTGVLLKSGSGTLTLESANTSVTTLNVAAGKLVYNSTSATTHTLTGNSGSTFEKTGTGKLTASINNYKGNLLISNGELSLTSVTGSIGSITAGEGSKLELASGVTLTLDSGTSVLHTVANHGIISVKDAQLTVNGNLTGGTLEFQKDNAASASITLKGATNNLNKIDFGKDGAANGTLILAGNTKTEVDTGGLYMNSDIIIKLGTDSQLTVDGATMTGLGDTSSISMDTGNKGQFTVNESNAAKKYNLNNLEVSINKDSAVTFQHKLAGSSLSNTGSGELTVSNAGNTITTLAAAKGNVKLSAGMNVDSISASAGKTVTVVNGNTVSMGNGAVAISGSNGADAVMTARSNSALVQLQRDASFTIEDMMLTNTEITAATVNTRVELKNVSGTATLKRGTFALQATPATTTVGTGGAAISYGAEGNPSLTLARTEGESGATRLMISADPTGDVAGAFGTYTLTFSLNLNLDSSIATPADGTAWQALVGFEGWLGQMLVDQDATYNVGEAPAVAEGGTAAPTVSYSYTAGTGSNVGTLSIVVAGLNVPEPTTGTLGLLSLVALAARRRRK